MGVFIMSSEGQPNPGSNPAPDFGGSCSCRRVPFSGLEGKGGHTASWLLLIGSENDKEC